MFIIGGLLLYLGIARKMEPFLLVPIGFGIFIANLPLAGLMVYTLEGLPVPVPPINELATAMGKGEIGLLNVLYAYGIETEVIPLLIFLGLGAMTDFTPTIARPISFIFGAVAQVGVFAVFLIAYLTGIFTVNEAACVGIIGGSDGPPAWSSYPGSLFLYGSGAPYPTANNKAAHYQAGAGDIYETSGAPGLQAGVDTVPDDNILGCRPACSKISSARRHVYVW